MGRDRILEDTERLTETAFALIDEDGYEKFSARKLAGLLGISHMTVYNYMKRDEIFDAVIARGFNWIRERMLPRVQLIMSGQAAPSGFFLLLAEGMLDLAIAHPNVYRLMFQSPLGMASDNAEIRAMYMGGIELLRGAIPEDTSGQMYGDVLLFLLLVNGLVLSYIGGMPGQSEAACRAALARAHELIIARYSL